ncbi:carbamate kinase [Caldivirga sp. UBA161]|uniref:carbamate kinase n=1 Tax=Caldivirga sp. UBA161 TaxID=1915569 RepID=UPI0025C3511C|nr:carbamate kinase [Caldivirga sp. UBA161]
MMLVIALGGNAFAKTGSRVGSPKDQLEAVREAAVDIINMVQLGYRVIVTHGNGPQVGLIAERISDSLSLDMAVAATEGWMGYLLANAIEGEAKRRGLDARAAAIVTRVMVNSNDEAFRNPTKFIGPAYSEAEAVELSRVKDWVFRRDPRGGWRRVVPSPRPVSIIEADVIKQLINNGNIIIAVGGGGVPVINHEGVEAVIDKDLAAQLLANSIGADELMILSDVDYVYLNYGKPNQEPLTSVSVSELRRYYNEGQFPEGNMGPKVEAVIRFIEGGGRRAYIGRLGKAIELIKGITGTVISP